MLSESWPLPLAGLAIATGSLIWRSGSRSLFFATHFWLEIALVIALFAAHLKLARGLYRPPMLLGRAGMIANGTLVTLFWLAMIIGRLQT